MGVIMRDNDETYEYVTCGCCGRGVRNNAEENTHFNDVPYPDDNGFGMCVECGGDKNHPDIQNKLGWAGRCFFEARFDVVRNQLSEASGAKAKWDRFSYEKKCAMVARLVEKGVMI